MNDFRFSYSENTQRSHFSLGTEFSNLTSQTASVSGFGPRAGFEYGLTDRWSLGSNVVFSLQMSGKVGALFYSGINGLVRYSFSGAALKQMGILKRADGLTIYELSQENPSRVSGIFGVDQLFLNGTSSIYPAVGMTLGISYGTSLFGSAAEFDIRYAGMTANDNPLNMIAIGGQINLDF